MDEYKPNANSAKCTADDDVHEDLLLNYRFGEKWLQETDEKAYHCGSEYGADYKLAPNNAPCHSEEEEVEDVLGDGDGYSELEINQ